MRTDTWKYTTRSTVPYFVSEDDFRNNCSVIWFFCLSSLEAPDIPIDLFDLDLPLTEWLYENLAFLFQNFLFMPVLIINE